MRKVLNNKGETVTEHQAQQLFHQGHSICEIAYKLGLFQNECQLMVYGDNYSPVVIARV